MGCTTSIVSIVISVCIMRLFRLIQFILLVTSRPNPRRHLPSRFAAGISGCYEGTSFLVNLPLPLIVNWWRAKKPLNTGFLLQPAGVCHNQFGPSDDIHEIDVREWIQKSNIGCRFKTIPQSEPFQTIDRSWMRDEYHWQFE